MKPPGLTHDFRVTHATRTEDAVWDAVAEAIAEGWTVERFRRECALAWESELKDAAAAATLAWNNKP